MSNDARKARDRRRLEKCGGKNLPALTIHDYEGWIEVLREEGYFREDQEADLAAVRKSTEYWIKDLCRDYRREQADKLIHARTGLLERMQPAPGEINLPPPEPAHPLSTRFSEGGHWSLRPGHKKYKGRKLSEDEKVELLKTRPDLSCGWMSHDDMIDALEDDGASDEDEGASAAEVLADIGTSTEGE